MNNHGLAVGMLIISLAAVIALFIWRALIGIKYKNNAEAKKVITKARAFSALSLWVVYLCWGAIVFFIDADAIFDNVKTMVAVLLGFQSTMELGAGIYYQKKMGGSKE